LVYFKDRSSRMPIYVWDELYFFKGSYSIRIMQWSREVIHRKCLFKEINMLLQERSTFKDAVWRTDKEKKNFWPKYRADFYRTFGPICRKHHRIGLIFTCQVQHISICLLFVADFQLVLFFWHGAPEILKSI
jgi:hypothetical protein